jgi:protein associated with RNAse G/E
LKRSYAVRTSEAERPLVEVRSLKYDGSLKRSWRARLAHVEGELVVLEGVFEAEIRHALLGTILEGTRSTEFFWTDRWYSVFRFREPGGGPLRNFYGNINTPPRLEGDTLSFIDLDIDVLVRPDFSYTILDEDEFEQHARHFDYPEEFSARALKALDELRTLIDRRDFPFDPDTAGLSSLDNDFDGRKGRNYFE